MRRGGHEAVLFDRKPYLIKHNILFTEGTQYRKVQNAWTPMSVCWVPSSYAIICNYSYNTDILDWALTKAKEDDSFAQAVVAIPLLSDDPKRVPQLVREHLRNVYDEHVMSVRDVQLGKLLHSEEQMVLFAALEYGTRLDGRSLTKLKNAAINLRLKFKDNQYNIPGVEGLYDAKPDEED
jgi:hypothetical protein